MFVSYKMFLVAQFGSYFLFSFFAGKSSNDKMSLPVKMPKCNLNIYMCKCLFVFFGYNFYTYCLDLFIQRDRQ